MQRGCSADIADVTFYSMHKNDEVEQVERIRQMNCGIVLWKIADTKRQTKFNWMCEIESFAMDMAVIY